MTRYLKCIAPCGNPVRGTGNQVKELVMIDPTQMAPAIVPAISRPTRKPVGITKGPGESTHEYTFVSRDDEQELKNGEYVYYELTDSEAQQGQAPRTGVINHAPPVIATRSHVG